MLASPTGIEAQQRLFPQVPSFELPEASPRVHGLVGRLLSARHGDSRFGNEGEAEVALGENVPVLALREGRRPITLGFGSQVYARFSLSDSKSALISNDWVVGFNGTATVEPWAFTLELYHESSHLGDEYEDRFNATLAVSPNALKDADERDRERAAGKVRGPLHGIPIALKDNVHTTTMPTTGGAFCSTTETRKPPFWSAAELFFTMFGTSSRWLAS